jgi:hypothetical protein
VSKRPVHSRFHRSLLIFAGVFLAIALAPRRAHAYAWMIGHGYAGCAICHLDPSGAGLLNEFGREEAADTLRSHYGSDPAPVEPFFGLWKNPDWLLTGGSFRDGLFFMKAGTAPYSQQNILMQADLRAGIDAGRWRAAASLGVLTNGDFPASVVTSDGGPSLVAREYWTGYTFENDTVLLRAGRINVPYGIRSIEHTLFVRVATQTDINDTQEHGVALAFRGSGFRGELMAIAGNYQESPDAYRQRGYGGYVEWSPNSHYAFGLNSLVTYAKQDVSLGVANLRQAQGLTLRAAPVDKLVVLGEADYVGEGLSGQPHWNGLATMLQADFEPWQGLHFIGTGETYGSGQPGTDASWSMWGSVAWFFYSHVDVRFDYVHQSLSTPPPEGRIPIETYLVQLHLFL